MSFLGSRNLLPILEIVECIIWINKHFLFHFTTKRILDSIFLYLKIGISRASVIKSNDPGLSTTTRSTTKVTTTPIPYTTTSLHLDSQPTGEYVNTTTDMPTVSSSTAKSTTSKITTPITTLSPTSTEPLTTYFVGTTLDPAVAEAERQRKEMEEKQKRIEVKLFAYAQLLKINFGYGLSYSVSCLGIL